jgi:hypothetical protein
MPGIEGIRPVENGLELFCDCGATTVLVSGEQGAVEAITAPGDLETISVWPGGGKVAFTCPGCGTAHWLTFTPREDTPGEVLP